VLREVLIEWIVLRDQHRQRLVAPTAGAPGLLPHRGAGSRVAGQHRRVEGPDVDAELERVRGRDRDEVAVRELLLDLPAVLGEVAGSVGPDRSRAPARRTRRVA
jgi:hypothetical protein